ncbi:unnamed protein product [Mytilus coruscus]|uniref:Uncharacterized protein n=1 Tax=Mytilus coruscus TaxID=42192 RepID=A0A6J8DE50_MYTCO|nr:unnamed protein product [Mytilus coruscus]
MYNQQRITHQTQDIVEPKQMYNQQRITHQTQDIARYTTLCKIKNLAQIIQNVELNVDIRLCNKLVNIAERYSTQKSKKGKQKQNKKGNNTKIVVVNFQSIKNKKEELLNMIDTSNPEIILRTETWLRPDILSSEIFPPQYSVYRKDRTDGYGGVLIAVRDIIISEELHVPIQWDTESLYIRVTTPDSKSIIV